MSDGQNDATTVREVALRLLQGTAALLQFAQHPFSGFNPLPPGGASRDALASNNRSVAGPLLKTFFEGIASYVRFQSAPAWDESVTVSRSPVGWSGTPAPSATQWAALFAGHVALTIRRAAPNAERCIVQGEFQEGALEHLMNCWEPIRQALAPLALPDVKAAQAEIEWEVGQLAARRCAAVADESGAGGSHAPPRPPDQFGQVQGKGKPEAAPSACTPFSPTGEVGRPCVVPSEKVVSFRHVCKT